VDFRFPAVKLGRKECGLPVYLKTQLQSFDRAWIGEIHIRRRDIDKVPETGRRLENGIALARASSRSQVELNGRDDVVIGRPVGEGESVYECVGGDL